MSGYELEAIRFEHYATFVDFVRQYGRSGVQGEFELLECAWADGGAPPVGEPERVLMLGRSDRAWPTNPAFFVQRIQVDDERVQMLPGRRHRKLRAYRVVSRRRADRLPALVGPVLPHLGAGVEPPVVVFWFEDEGLFRQIVTMNFQLGCDRLQATVAALGAGSAEERRVYMLQAERPSYWTVDIALAERGARVFIPQGGGQLFVPWGTVHPLAELWEGAPGRWVFMDGVEVGARVYEMASPEWTDIYGLTRFEVQGLSVDEAWQPRAEVAVRFEVPLTLIPAHKKRDAQVWMLGGGEHSRLERLLTLIPERDLQALQFSCQETAEGESMYFVRERHTGVGREYIDFQGAEFAPWAGYPNLLLPVDQTLEPPLRKDRYREIFDLKARELVFLWSLGGKLRVVRVAESSFRPLPELVDYIIGAGLEALKAAEARVVFDFQRYEAAPRRPLATGGAPKEGTRRVIEERERNLGPGEELALEEIEIAASTALEREELVLPTHDAEEESAEDELERAEAELERALIVEGQELARWEALARVKRLAGKLDDEVMCHKEGLWLAFAEKAPVRPLVEALLAAYERHPDHKISDLPPRERHRRAESAFAAQDAPVGWIWLYVHYELARIGREIPEGSARNTAIREFLSRAYKTLDGVSTRLRYKDRWLLWRALLEQNQDAMQESKVREALLLELTRNGLQPFDVPGFIQNRIYQSRFIQDDDPEAESEFLAASAILDAVAARIERAEDEVLRRIGASVLAYGFERIGHRARSDQYALQAEGYFESGTGLEVIEQAWVALYLAATRELQQPGGGANWARLYNQRLRQHATAGLAQSELEVVQRTIFKRTEVSNPSEFFSPENFRSLFPMAGKYTEAQQIKRDLDELVNAGRFNQALSELRALAMRARDNTLRLDARQFAWLLSPITDALRKIGQAVEGIEILSQFEESVDRFRQGSLMGLYSTLLRLRLAEGFLDLGEEGRGTEMIRNVVHGAYRERSLQWLDHLDMLGAGLGVIEIVPLQHRGDAVNEVLNALFLDERHPQDSATYRPIKLRLIDHCMEVALSKEKLSLKRYKLYMDEDEYHVRNRIVNDRVTER